MIMQLSTLNCRKIDHEPMLSLISPTVPHPNMNHHQVHLLEIA